MLNGIDVSRWQGSINWSQVGKDFAIIKATGGDMGLYLDPQAYLNYRQAKNAGILVAQYHFAGGGDPTEEAHYFVNMVSPLEDNDVLVLDWEIDYNDPVGWCKIFCDTVRSITGINPIVYMSLSRVLSWDWSTVAQDCALWVAKYGINDGTLAGAGDISSTGAFNCIAWQYTSVGRCGGIAGNVDLDVFYGTKDQFKAYGWHPAPQPQPEPQPKSSPSPSLSPSASVSPSPSVVPPTPVKPSPSAPVKPTISFWDWLVGILNIIKNWITGKK